MPAYNSVLVSGLRRLGLLPPAQATSDELKYASYLMHRNLSRAERERWLKAVFYKRLGYNLNLKQPRTFNEKINWMKLNYRHPDMPRIVDKYSFKSYLKERVGDEYVVPLLGAWVNEEDIVWSSLPDRFVLKSNNCADGENILIVKDKSALKVPAVTDQVCSWLQPWNTLNRSFCWAYENVQPMIIAEEYIEQQQGQVYDYKYFCYNGCVRYCYVATEHFVKGVNNPRHLISLYDLDWTRLPLVYGNHAPNHAGRPLNHQRMIELAQQLSQGFAFCRVDFYEVGTQIYVGEMTFYPGGGYNRILPIEWDYLLGELLRVGEEDLESAVSVKASAASDKRPSPV